ncbi:MAG: hypothetical protein U9Q03_02580 [Patescibacteria group bacterium]|nr:hypothetical protein [Patescibacteria group bacterium]
MAKLDLKKISGKTAARMSMVIVILLSAGAVIAMGIFIIRTMNKISGESFTLSEADQEAIEKIDLDGLADLQAGLEEKNALDEARAGRPHNPFSDITIRRETAINPGGTEPEPEPEADEVELPDLPEPDEPVEPDGAEDEENEEEEE